MNDHPHTHLPMTRAEMTARGWTELDVLLVTGDAYFDHPSHGAATIGRFLEAEGYRVGIVARPDWKKSDDFTVMGRPLLYAGVTAGAVDSTLNNFTADLKRRRDDAYAPGGKGMGRPKLATVVYANRLRESFPGLPVVLGGIEASTRRFAYWDYATSKIRRSVLVDSRADVLVWGPGETQALEIAHRLASGDNLEGIPGTARLVRADPPDSAMTLPSFERLEEEPRSLLTQTAELEVASSPGFPHPVVQTYREGTVLCEPRARQDVAIMDSIHGLPFTRRAHPSYPEEIPALETVRWSVISHRGCPGGCSFCALAIHQGRRVVPRSAASILKEIRQLAEDPKFGGTVTDIGGPTANALGARPRNSKKCVRCKRVSCLYPAICSNLETSHDNLLKVLEGAAKVPGVKKVLLASGIRHDLALRDPIFIEIVAARHTGGHLKVAPEHVDPGVLKLMRKPPVALLEEFERIFLNSSELSNLRQYLVPYFIAGFPGCTITAGDAAGAWLETRGQKLEQVQTFIPLPGTMAAAMYAVGESIEGPIYIPDPPERARQKSLLTDRNLRRRTERSPRTGKHRGNNRRRRASRGRPK